MSRGTRAADPVCVDLDIESLDLDAQGVAHHDGKVVFVTGALPGERVRAAIKRSKPRFDTAEAVAVLRESSQRARPRCAHFGVCGGCSMQHLDPLAQIAVKQRALEDQLHHLGRVSPDTMLRPIAGPPWGYRYRARLSVRHVPKKGGVLVGFHERGSSYVADMRECHVLHPAVARLLLPLRALVSELSLRDRLPQIEVAVGELGGGEPCVALVLRVLQPPTPEDLARLRQFAADESVELWLQPKGPDSIELLCNRSGREGESSLGYRLAEFDVAMPYRPTDFTQVNHAINEVLVRRAVALLAPAQHERIADLFCGLGNFSLPLARRASEVVGIEGSQALVARATDNAAANGLAAKTRFRVKNLFEMDAQAWRSLEPFDRLLIDPPREGALEVCKSLADQTGEHARFKPQRIVYVSCNPATLARDAGVLVNVGGYRLSAAGAVNMFPHTSHVESIAVFERGE
jgi:23S rRNA (uracil1939-C5)-methyltransferase